VHCEVCATKTRESIPLYRHHDRSSYPVQLSKQSKSTSRRAAAAPKEMLAASTQAQIGRGVGRKCGRRDAEGGREGRPPYNTLVPVLMERSWGSRLVGPKLGGVAPVPQIGIGQEKGREVRRRLGGGQRGRGHERPWIRRSRRTSSPDPGANSAVVVSSAGVGSGAAGGRWEG
jgi:hypothetical protein